jgi:hypothetical protein
LEKSGGLWGSGLLCGLKRADGWAHWRIPRGGFLRFHHSNGGVHLSVRLQCATCPRQVRRPPQCPRTRLIVCKTVRLCTCTLHFDRSRCSTAMLLHQPSSYRLFCDREYMDSRTQAPLQSCHTPVELERCAPKFRRYGQSKTKRHSNACLHRVRDRALVLCEGVTTLVSFPHIRRHMISVFLPWTLIHKPAQRPIFWSKQSSSRPPASINRSICDDIASKVSVCTPLLDDLTDPEQQTSSQHHDELRTWKISSRSVTGYTSDLPVLRALHGIPDASFALRRYRRA